MGSRLPMQAPEQHQGRGFRSSLVIVTGDVKNNHTNRFVRTFFFPHESREVEERRELGSRSNVVHYCIIQACN